MFQPGDGDLGFNRGRGRGNRRNGHRGGRGAGWGRGIPLPPQGIPVPPRGRGGENNRRAERTERVRMGPVFGFQRLNGMLSSEPDEVILSIVKDLNDWEDLLKSDNLVAKSDSLLHLVMHILGSKICCDTVLANQQVEILLATTEESFIDKIVKHCTDVLLGIEQSHRRFHNQNSEFIEVDKSPTTFLKNLHSYSQFMLKKMPEIAVDYIQRAVASAFAAISMKLATSTDGSFNQLHGDFQNLISDMQLVVKKREEKQKAKVSINRNVGFTVEESNELHAMEAPNDFREIPTVPCAGELRSKEDVFLRPNKTTGAYIDTNHYLDVQFRLLREDFVQPLKKGVQDFMRNRFDYLSRKKRIPLGTIRIYPDAQIISCELVRDAVVYKVQLPEDCYKKIRWEKSKRLLTGSLLVFTSDFFQNAFFAVVASRITDELKKGIVSVVWEGGPPVWDRDDEYLMVECEVYFEAYRHTLQILKELELDTFPMSKFIVEASSDVGPPKYLDEAEHFMKLELKDGREKYISPLISTHWPSHEDLGLDKNQFTAFQSALTREFTIIQGPPGTGKTFLGLKIAEVFLNNEDIWNINSKGPILVVCYTNHALDQFLEGILDVYQKTDAKDPSIVRVGGRCQSEKLADYTLQNVSRRKSRSMPKHFWPNKHEIRDEIDSLRHQR